MAFLFRRKTEETAVSAAAPSAVPERAAGVLIGSAQDIGKRKEQQDCFDVAELENGGLLAVLADGMGGMADGALYSGTAVKAALKACREDGGADEMALLRVVRAANEAVLNAGLTGGGTTLIAALIKDRKLFFVSVGDSRICLLRGGGLIQLNREHSYGRTLDDYAANGRISWEKAAGSRQRAAITSFIGKSDGLDIDRNLEPIPLLPGDKVVLMSDGVFGFLSEAELTRQLGRPPREACGAVRDALLNLNHPYQDNLTIVVLEAE